MNKLPALYHKDKNSKVRFWQCWTEGAEVVTEYGEVGGKTQFSRELCIEKNVGKKNYLSPEMQAEAQAKSAWEFKLKRKYFKTPEECEDLNILPMLAKEFEQKKVVFPCVIQKKLDGFRFLMTSESKGKIKGITRSSNDLPAVEHLKIQAAALLGKYPNLVLDGEIYSHDITFQEVCRLAKKYREGETEKLQYWIYDVIDLDNLDLSYAERRKLLEEVVGNGTDHIHLLDEQTVNSFDEINEKDAENVTNGYEGSIIRNLAGTYEVGFRSSDLLKVKQFEDKEFKVVGAKEGVGKFAGLATFVCQNDLTDATFEACPKGTLEEKAEMWTNKDNYIGQIATVKFFGRTEAELPRFPVLKGFRLDEDIQK